MSCFFFLSLFSLLYKPLGPFCIPPVCFGAYSFRVDIISVLLPIQQKKNKKNKGHERLLKMKNR